MSDIKVVDKSSQSDTEVIDKKELHGTTQIVESDESESGGDTIEPCDNFDNENSATNNLESTNETVEQNDEILGQTNEIVEQTNEILDDTDDFVDETKDMETITINSDSDSDTDDEIKQLAKDADREQMIKVYLLFIVEIFKVAMASFLALSVVQSCEGEVCSYDQNVKRESGYGNFVISVNIINVVAFAILYFFEFNREMFLIEYLDIDKRKGDYHLPKVLNEYGDIKIRLKKYNRAYYVATRSVLLLTAVNWILSGILVIGSYYSFKTITSFVTNILLVITKLSDSHGVSKESHQNDYGLSAYIKEYTSFNVIDRDHLKEEHKE
tara:strand:- start:27047 stop:28024 length:978 start_codon:yes stop_codon:yes gene_type:complete